MAVTAFDSLHPRILMGLKELGITEPTPPQEKAIGPISSGSNVLLVAPTASGKTEAALLPIFDALIRRDKPAEGIEVIYITPLRALNRDIHKRLMFWGEHLGIDVQIRHGDTSQRMRRRQLVRPPRLLITTPETLQALLPTIGMRKHLESVRWVVVDEIHELAASKRGAQLTLGLERLQRLASGPLQRIGLSATVGNPDEVARFLGGRHPVDVLEVEVDKSYSYSVEFPEPKMKDFDLADDLATTPEAASRLGRIRELIGQRNSTLVFVQGRGQAESLGHKLGKLDKFIEVHHGSLSREQRHEIEDRFKAGDLKGIVCTSTLQLGIDIGDVDLSIQYLSPRQVSTLIQRVGRSGHTLSKLSEGVLISAYGEDALESMVISERARRGDLEPTAMHIKAYDVLAHQLVGIALDEEQTDEDVAFEIVTGSYPFKGISREEFSDFVEFLASIGSISKKGTAIRNRKRGRMYYYENLGMINDERRYPFIDVVTDRVIGTVGDEFWTLRARIGLNVILKGRIWRILQIDEERGVLHVLPSEDPLGALPGWDGELIPVPREVAQEVAELREKVALEIDRLGSKEKAVEELTKKLDADEAALRSAADEVEAHLKAGFPIPTRSRILLEACDKYLVVHSSYGERVNRTLGAVFDAILSDNDLIYIWWNDSYRILVEAPRRLDKFDLRKMEEILFHLSEEEVDKRLEEFIEARFPFAYRMKFIAERFGVIPRGKTLDARSLENLYIRYKDTPIHWETLREVHMEKLDLAAVKEIMVGVASGEIEVVSILADAPSPLAKHILEEYADVAELMDGQNSVSDQLDYMRKSVHSRLVDLTCMSCGEWSTSKRVRDLDEKPTCGNCGSGLLAVLRRYQDSGAFLELYSRWRNGDSVSEDDRNLLTKSRKTADMVLSYGRKAVEAFMVRGVGPVTSYQVLSRMHQDEKAFYSDLLKAKIQYMKTRQYWDEK
ncbi:MAG: DEAD/DEAH box helicase [Candidatus Bathyarchaeota archaeon]|nr:MAG: DEAD/DEAH box helicase [Candidatus Bathyarchaeota archaeon]